MSTFQFYQKDKVALHLDVNSPSFLAESEQLIDQGFERIGDIVEAENSQIAHEKFKTIHDGKLTILAKSQLVVGIATAGTGGL